MNGIAGNSAELLNESKNSASVNMVRSATFRKVEALARSGFGFSASKGVSLGSSEVTVSIVFVAVNAALLVSFFSFSSLSRLRWAHLGQQSELR
jgi:hypothetical protein